MSEVCKSSHFGNFVYNTCTSANDGGDCGALYTQDNTAKSTNITISGNFIRDGNPWRGMNAGSAIYLDDCLSNATVSGNVMTGTNGANTSFIHGGKSDVYIGNIYDLGTYGQHISVWQTSANTNCNVMTGNKYSGNIIISKGGDAGYSDLSYPNTVTPTVSGNLYYDYAGGTISTGPESNAIKSDPGLSACFSLAADSVAYKAPLDLSPLLKDWGPPGYELPGGATEEPSYPSSTCY